jgi:hypothetical protein
MATEIIDMYGKYITLLHPENTLSQLQTLIDMIEQEPDLNADELPAAYWIDLHNKVSAIVNKNL